MTEFTVNRKCLVCNLPVEQRKELDRAIVRGTPITKLSKRFHISRDAIYRHKNGGHIDAILEAGATKSIRHHARGMLDEMLARMQELTDRTENLLNTAEENNQIRNALLAVQQLRANYQTMGTIMASVGQNETMDPQEREEFEHWKQNKDNLHLDLLGDEDRVLIARVTMERIIEEGTQGEHTMDRTKRINSMYQNSYFLKYYGPSKKKILDLVEEIARKLGPNTGFTPRVDLRDLGGSDHGILTVSMEPNSEKRNPEEDLRVDPDDHSLKQYNRSKKKKELVRTRTKPKQ